MQIRVTRDKLISLWNSAERRVPLPVMLTTAQMESGVGPKLYNATAERFEEGLWERRGGLRSSYTSYGPFQIMGFNLDDLGFYNYALMHDQVKTHGADPDEYLLLMMDAYDSFMSRLMANGGIEIAFRRYNGSGPAAESYCEKAMAIYEVLNTELEPGI